MLADIVEVGTTAKELCEHTGRRECSLADVLHAIDAVGAAPHPLELQHLAMDNRLAFPSPVPAFPAVSRSMPTGSPPRASPRASPRGSPSGFPTAAARGEALGWRRDKDGRTNQQLSVPMFLPGLPPPFTFTGAPVFANPFAGAGTAPGSLALPPLPAGGAAATQQDDSRATPTERVLSRLRPLLEPLVRQRGSSWEEALPTLAQGGEVAALDAALCGADADASSEILEKLLATVAAAKAQAEASAAVGVGGASSGYRATVAKVAAADGSADGTRETTPEAAPELLDARSQKRKAKEAEEERRRSKRRIAEPADLTLPTAGLTRAEETIGRAAMVDAAQKAVAAGAVGTPVGLPVDSLSEPPLVPIELPPEGEGAAALAAAAAAAAAEQQQQAAAAEGEGTAGEGDGEQQLSVAKQPMTKLMSSALKTLLTDLLNRGLPNPRGQSPWPENGQATGIFDVDLAEAVPHYREIVPEPMDLGTMKRKLQRNVYPTALEFEADFRRVIIACKQYNIRDKSHVGYADGQYYLKLGAVLEGEFNRRWEKVIEDMTLAEEERSAKAKRKLARASSSAAASASAAAAAAGGGGGGGGGIKLAVGGAKVAAGGSVNFKKRRPPHLRNAAYWRGDEGVARAVRMRVEGEEAEGKRLGGGGGGAAGGAAAAAGGGGRGGGRPNRRENLLMNRHRESDVAAAAAAAAAGGGRGRGRGRGRGGRGRGAAAAAAAAADGDGATDGGGGGGASAAPGPGADAGGASGGGGAAAAGAAGAAGVGDAMAMVRTQSLGSSF
jgi:hypothetical protein